MSSKFIRRNFNLIPTRKLKMKKRDPEGSAAAVGKIQQLVGSDSTGGDMRSAWAQKIRDILKPDGELITLMFPISDHIGGPPYKVSVSDYEEVLHPMGFKAISISDNDLAVLPRKGREKLGRWKMSASKSTL